MTVEKPIPKQLLRPITTGTNSAMNQSHFLAITCNSLEAREKSRVHDAIGFGFASNRLKNWRESFKPVTKRSNCNHEITFGSHLKTALIMELYVICLFLFKSMCRLPWHRFCLVLEWGHPVNLRLRNVLLKKYLSSDTHTVIFKE